MGTSAFDKLWGTDPATPAPKPPTAFDALWDGTAQKHDYHAEFKSGALQKRMAGANAREAANLKDEQDAQPGFLSRVATHVLNTAQGIPGVEAVEAAAGALGSRIPNVSFGGGVPPTVTPSSPPLSYRQSLGALRGQTSQIGNKVSIAEHVAGSLPLASFLPASPVKAGAAVGAAEGLLSADPDQSVAGRAGRGAIGATTGAVAGKLGETAISGGRALLAKGAARNLVDRTAARAASAKQMYSAALAEGKGKEATDAVKDFLHETGIEEIVDELKQTRPFQTVAHDGPEMLDAVYKVLSDRAASLKKGLDAVTPNRPNIGRFRLQDTKAAQSRLLDALGTPGEKTVTTTAPPITTAQSPAPDIRTALNNFWTRFGVSAQRQDGTPAQQMARQALERHGAESVVSPPLRGAPPGERTITETVPVPPVMPGYRNAVEDYAQRSGDIEGVQRGYDALRLRLKDNLPTAKNLLRKSPEALQEWAKTATPSQIRAAAEGALGAAKGEVAAKPIKSLLADALLRGPTAKVGPVLRDAADPTQALSDQLMKLLLLSGAASRQ